MKTIEVVAAIIYKNDKYLCLQRNAGKHEYISYKYEFPGGKIENGESREQALIREIHEELSINISIESFYQTVDYTYPDFRLIMHAYKCTSADVKIKLNAHIAFQWLSAEELLTLDWAAADLPIVQNLMKSQ